MQEVVLLAQRIEGFDISKDENKRESRPAATEARRILHSPDYRRKNRVHKGRQLKCSKNNSNMLVMRLRL